MVGEPSDHDRPPQSNPPLRSDALGAAEVSNRLVEGLGRIARLVHKCLSVDPGKRFASAGELHEALEAERLRLGLETGSPAERLVAFLYRDGHLSAEEALTVVDPALLEATRNREAPPGGIRPYGPLFAGFLAAVALVVVAVATWDTWLPALEQLIVR